jgi:hypothetical protein
MYVFNTVCAFSWNNKKELLELINVEKMKHPKFTGGVKATA